MLVYPDKNQRVAIDKLESGNILLGGVGSGKSLTALTWFFEKVCGGVRRSKEDFQWITNPKDIYIITTAKKRDSFDWQNELSNFFLWDSEIKAVVDSWNNLHKYVHIKNAVFLFDEQRISGSGEWVKWFLKIVKNNLWLLLTATPGDTWMDYIPVFMANGFYKTRGEFTDRHVVYAPYVKFPKVQRYLEVSRLIRLRELITVNLHFVRNTRSHVKRIYCDFDRPKQDRIYRDRWNVYEEEPIKNVSEMCLLLRKLVNSDKSRTEEFIKKTKEHPKLIVFYNFNFEWEILKETCEKHNIPYSSYNGHVHEEILKTDSWVYLVQYMAGNEAWECTETNAMVFYSGNYSYKQTTQASGRIDRRNTPFNDLYYYHFTSNSIIDNAISNAFAKKRNFNEKRDIRF